MREIASPLATLAGAVQRRADLASVGETKGRLRQREARDPDVLRGRTARTQVAVPLPMRRVAALQLDVDGGDVPPVQERRRHRRRERGSEGALADLFDLEDDHERR